MPTERGLPAELTIYTVGDVRSQCLAWLGESDADKAAVAALATDHWGLDASAVDQVDAAGVQLLLALARTLDGPGLPLRLVRPSAPLVEACTALGLADWLSEHTLSEATA